MWIDSDENLLDLVKKIDFVVVTGFEKNPQTFFGRNSFVIEKDDDKTKISVEKVQEIISLAKTKNQIRQLFVVNHAEDLSESAGNAFLKLLEEPSGNNAFLFLVNDIGQLLPTIKSRAAIFRIKQNKSLTEEMKNYDEAERQMAKILVAGKSYDIVKVANLLAKECTKNGTAGREKTKRIFLIALKMLEKMLENNPKMAWIKRANKIETALRNIAKNLNVRLVILSLA
jgi:DNA polymerase III delta prime subunit